VLIGAGRHAERQWLLRELQLEAAWRTAQRRELLQPPRGRAADRGVASALRHRQAAQRPRLPTPSTRSDPAPTRRNVSVGARSPAHGSPGINPSAKL